ncbi:MAG TPA: methyltransferase domain-containing protein [Candidatus Dormibacteraeota bacterium]|nr:methyltransferase domain-containing protein [Candidatus Dormibacteraeota bacterium]
MRYSEAVATAPPGSARFSAADLARLCRSTLDLLLTPGPSAPPLEDVAAALAGRPAELFAVASALPPARGERLLRLSQRPAPADERSAAATRVVRGAFWYLAYELEPDLWDRLAFAEPVAPELLTDLPADGARVLEVAAGSGRLTASLAGRAAWLLAVEPCPPLLARLRRRLPDVAVVTAVGHRLPVVSGWADLVVSCAAFGPDPPLGGEEVRRELERCARPGGTVALVSPEAPAWWQERGYTLREYPEPAATLDADVEAFFGPPHPPRRLLYKRVAR